MVWLLLLALVGTGILAGTIGSLIGLGGGVVIVPVLIYLSSFIDTLEVTPQLAVGTSLAVIVVISIASTLSYSKQKVIDYRNGFILFSTSGPGALFGSYLNAFLDVKWFSLYFGAFIIMISLILMIQSKLPVIQVRGPGMISSTFTDPATGQQYDYNYSIAWALPISFLVGMLSGLFGIGGGALMVPVLILLFRFPPKLAAATSMFIILFSSLSGSVYHISVGNVEWSLLIGLVPGAWIGGKFGAMLSHKLQSRTIEMALRIVLIIIGLRLILEII